MSSTIQTSERFAALPDEQALLADTIAGLEARGFSVKVVDALDGAGEAVLARMPQGAYVTTNASMTSQETGIAAAINDRGLYRVRAQQDDGAEPGHAISGDEAVTGIPVEPCEAREPAETAD
jgi:hypothetical protein